MANMNKNCVFCNLIEIDDNDIVFPTSSYAVVRFEPLNPVTPGHMLFVPKLHSKDATDDISMFSTVMLAAADWARQNLKGAFNIITSKGSDATQTVFHTHVHLVPRRENDGLHLPWTGQIKNEQ